MKKVLEMDDTQKMCLCERGKEIERERVKMRVLRKIVVATFCPGQIVVATFCPGQNIATTFCPGQNIVTTFCPGQNALTTFCPILVLQPPRERI